MSDADKPEHVYGRRYTITASIGFSNHLASWAAQAGIRCIWDVPAPGKRGPTRGVRRQVTIAFPTIEDRTALLALARRKIAELKQHFPEAAGRLQREYEAIV